LRREDRVPFAQAVWASFQHKAGTTRDMSSAEFMTVSRWMDRSIPLPVVLRAIHEFDGTPRRLEACEASVVRAEAYWFQAMGGI
jgi:hypothetical protein